MLSSQENTLLFDLIDSKRELISLSGWMTAEGQDVKGDAIVVLTDYSLSVFQYNSESKLVQKFKAWLVATKSIEYDGKQSFTFTYHNSQHITLTTPVLELIRIYQMHLHVLLLDEEFPTIPEKALLEKSEIPVGPVITKRFVAFSMLQNQFPNTNLIRDFETFMRTSPVDFSLSDVPGLDVFFETFLIAMLAENKIKHLIINGKPPSPYHSLNKHINALKSIQWITLNITPDEYFPDFLKSIANLNVNRIDFEDIAISSQALDALNIFTTNREIMFLSFNHVSFDMLESRVLDIFTNIVRTNHVRILGFTTMRFDKRRDLLETLFGLKCLYLIGTGLDLSLLLKILSKTKVTVADFTGSRCRKLLDPNIRLNSNVYRIILNHISYTAESLSTLFNIFASHTQPLSVSLSYAHLTPQHWQEFFTKKISLKNIQVLIWTQNPLNQQFIKLINKSSQLKYLGVGGRSEAKDVIEIIEKNSSIEYLDISGTEIKMGAQVMQVMNALKKSKKSIKHIDVSKNDIGNKNFQAFYELAMECMDDFLCDSNGFIDNEVYEKLFEEAKKKHHRIRATCPYFDYSNIRSKQRRKKILEDFEQYWAIKSSDSSLQGSEWKRRVMGNTESSTPPEDACDVTMVPAPLSDYEPLVNERALQGQSDEKSRNQWTLDTIDVPQITMESLSTELNNKFSFQNLTQTLYKIAAKQQTV